MVNNFSFKLLIFNLFIFSGLFFGCKSDYEKMLAAEKSKGVRHDEIWLGIHFGMQGKTFYDTCRTMNKSGILSHGTELPTTTRMDVSEHFSNRVYMNFFPEFDKEKGIVEVFAIFVYNDLIPWKNEKSQEILLAEAKNYLEKVLPGNSFLEIDHPGKGKIWVKVDGNRQVLLFKFEEQKVKAVITDLSFEKK